MKYLLVLTIGICLLAVPAIADQAADEAAIREAAKQFNAAFNKHDKKAVAASFDENIETWDGSRKGRDAVVKFLDDNPDASVKFLEEISIVFLTPDVAVHKFYEENSGWLDDEGKPMPPLKGLRAYAYVKKNGKWQRGAMFWRVEQ